MLLFIGGILIALIWIGYFIYEVVDGLSWNKASKKYAIEHGLDKYCTWRGIWRDVETNERCLGIEI